MNGKAFLDSNVLIYAHDRGTGRKHETAQALVEALWQERSGVMSTQVLQEFYVNVRRKAQRPIAPAEARRLLEDYLTWEIVINTGKSILEALDIEQQYGLSFWDALIVQAANAAGVHLLYSEDLNHGQMYGTVEVRNPFRP